MARKKMDTRSIGLDIGLAFSKFLTGKENLHYGLWDADFEVCAANLGRAQEAYTAKLFGLLPKGPLRILDIGGGAGETAKKLVTLGHHVEIVIPSAFLAERCRENAGPTAVVHECMFEDFQTDKTFDICMFSESFQYIPMELALEKSTGLLAKDGAIIVSDCFRTEPFFTSDNEDAKVGGGHSLAEFRDILSSGRFDVLFDEDITGQVAPSVEVEQDLFNVIGYSVGRVDKGLETSHPWLRRFLYGLTRLFLSKRRRERLDVRLYRRERSAANFAHFNKYVMVNLGLMK
jgi:SAM-dependent methyltransferase